MMPSLERCAASFFHSWDLTIIAIEQRQLGAGIAALSDADVMAWARARRGMDAIRGVLSATA